MREFQMQCIIDIENTDIISTAQVKDKIEKERGQQVEIFSCGKTLEERISHVKYLKKMEFKFCNKTKKAYRQCFPKNRKNKDKKKRINKKNNQC